MQPSIFDGRGRWDRSKTKEERAAEKLRADAKKIVQIAEQALAKTKNTSGAIQIAEQALAKNRNQSGAASVIRKSPESTLQIAKTESLVNKDPEPGVSAIKIARTESLQKVRSQSNESYSECAMIFDL